MKGTRKQYSQVNQLPSHAVTVRQYAESLGFTVAYIYKLYNNGKIDIVTFAGINFVLTKG